MLPRDVHAIPCDVTIHSALLQGDIWELRRTVLFAILGIPLLLPYNIVILCIVAVAPSFEKWYMRYLGFQQTQTHSGRRARALATCGSGG